MRGDLVIPLPRSDESRYPSKPGPAQRGEDFIQRDHAGERNDVNDSELCEDRRPESFDVTEKYDRRQERELIGRETGQERNAEPNKQRPGSHSVQNRPGGDRSRHGRAANRDPNQKGVERAWKMEQAKTDDLVRQPDGNHYSQ